VLACCAFSAAARADEGHWTADRFPTALVEQRYGVKVESATLQRAIRSTALVGGATTAFVSPRGLLALKVGDVKPCLYSLRDARRATGRFASLCRDAAVRAAIPFLDRLYCRPLERAAELDYVDRGHVARSEEEELRCPNLPISRLLEMRDVTDAFRDTIPMAEPFRYEAFTRLSRKLEAECEKPGGRSCQVVSLHGANVFHLYVSRRYTDVRVVLVPEERVADYGDLQDHLNFPDHDLPIALVRVYEDGKPLATPEFLRWSTRRLKEGDMTLLLTHPRSGLRFAASSQLALEREDALVFLPALTELRGALGEIAGRRPEVTPLFDLNYLNSVIRLWEATLPALTGDLVAAHRQWEAALIERLRQKDAVAATLLERVLKQAERETSAYLADGQHFRDLSFPQATPSALAWAIQAVALAKNPKLETARAYLLEPRVGEEEAQIAHLELSFRKLQETLPADDPFLRKVLAGQSAHARAVSLARATRLGDPAFRRRLVEAGPAAIAVAKDPVVELVAANWDELQKTRALDRRVAAINQQCGVLIARARHSLDGHAAYPGATGTVRITFGAVKGYQESGRTVAPITTLGDLFRLSRDGGPYQLPARWRQAEHALDLATPLDVAVTNDGFGSSILMDTNGDFLGVVFSGNRYFPASRISYDDVRARLVAAQAVAFSEALRHVYRAPSLLQELGVR
jgi:hypothetical protein